MTVIGKLKSKSRKQVQRKVEEKKKFSEIDDVVSGVNVFFFLLMSFNFLFLKKK